jgi:hypothetical protein
MNIGARTGIATLLATAVFPLLLVVAGCASYDGYTLKPGQATSADVERVMGKPVETRKVRGQTLLYYSREPNGGAIFVARIGPDDRLIDVEDRLTDANVAKIVPDVTTAGQLQNLLGPPWEKVHYALSNSTVWTWYMNSDPSELDVRMSPDGVVREVFRLDPYDD